MKKFRSFAGGGEQCNKNILSEKKTNSEDKNCDAITSKPLNYPFCKLSSNFLFYFAL